MKLTHSLSARITRGIRLLSAAMLATLPGAAALPASCGAAALFLLSGCVVEDATLTGQFDIGGIATDVASAQDENRAAQTGNQRPPRNNLQDGTSNTTAVNESNVIPTDGSVRPIIAVPGRANDGNNGGLPGNTPGASSGAPPDNPTSAPADSAPGGAANAPGAGSPATGSAPPPASSEAADEAALESQFANNRFEFGSSSFFSGGSITDNSDLVLCNGRRFGLLVTRITSTQFSTFSSESRLAGEWSIDVTPQGTDLVLNVQSASDPADVGLRRLPLTASNTTLFISGNAASISDATAACQ
ncbi:MAG: hypothetical protein HRU75_14145 [Planctomycetia bacterium]|nr:MAG: hypothetical protein HRU75_14145 [Planctomycetia bacterium]